MNSRDRRPDDGCPKDYNPKEAEKNLEEQIKNSKSSVEGQNSVSYLGRALTFVGTLGIPLGSLGVAYELGKPNSVADYNEVYYIALIVASGFAMLKGIRKIVESSRNSDLENKIEN